MTSPLRSIIVSKRASQRKNAAVAGPSKQRGPTDGDAPEDAENGEDKSREEVYPLITSPESLLSFSVLKNHRVVCCCFSLSLSDPRTHT